MTPTRRFLLAGGAATLAVLAVPFTHSGMEAFLRRVLSRHFGPDLAGIDGIDDFVSEFAALAGDGSRAKRAAAQAYFAWQIDRVYPIGAAEDLESRFLQTILTRSNIIAIHQGRETNFQFTEVDPWEPACGLYLSALADPQIQG